MYKDVIKRSIRAMRRDILDIETRLEDIARILDDMPDNYTTKRTLEELLILEALADLTYSRKYFNRAFRDLHDGIKGY